jgi:hypothetical protein
MEQATAARRESAPSARVDAHTEPVDYAALNAVWAALLVGVVAGTRGRASKDPIQSRELIPLAAATFGLSKAIAREKIGTWVREPFVDQQGGGQPRGNRLRRVVGELVTCTRCVGTWSALAVVGLRVANPEAGRTVSTVLATSAANDWLQAGFKLLTEQTNLVGSKLPPRD